LQALTLIFLIYFQNSFLLVKFYSGLLDINLFNCTFI